jgi:enoyl-CoA hydratase
MTVVSFSDEDDLGRITLESPPVNGFTHEFMHDMNDAIEAARESAPTVLLVESTLDDIFSAGGDLSWYVEADDQTLRNFVAYMHKTFRTLERLPIVTIAAIDGHCLAGGFELALACDQRIMTDGEWQLGCTETEIGAIPGGGGTQRLPREVGRATALDMIINARRISPTEAADLGLIQKLVDPDEFESDVQAYAERLANGPHRAYAAAKQAITNGMEMSLDEGLAYEQQIEYDLLDTADFKEGLEAFTNDRDPDFQGE